MIERLSKFEYEDFVKSILLLKNVLNIKKFIPLMTVVFKPNYVKMHCL